LHESQVANTNDGLSLEEALVLLREIQRLQSEIARYENRVRELECLAHNDALVGLANRRSLLVKLQRLIDGVEQFGVPAAVIFADVDGLKSINDTFGHTAGDKALVEISRLLVASVRKSDCVARLAGDEFCILLHQTEEVSAWQLALRVVETVDEHEFCIDQVCVPLSVAVGVAVVRRGDTPESVLERADKEMYRIKGLAPRMLQT
jgi:diguanylate cyclase (GGDEF)-like protein